MKIVVERQGGFAGIRRRGEREGGDLTEGQRRALEWLERTMPAPADPGADRFSYLIQVSDDRGVRTLQVPESLMPPELAGITRLG
jgi:hypothetical protein